MIIKHTLRLLSLTVAVGGIVFWIATGANRGWTRTTTPVKTVDEVTGIEGIEYKREFVPGLELLAGALVASAVMAGASALFRKRQATGPQAAQTGQ